MSDELSPLLAEVLEADAAMLEHFGIQFVEAGDGRAVLRATPRPEFVTSSGIARGSLVFILAETAAAYAVASQGLHSAAVTAAVAFTGKVGAGVEATAEAEITTAGRKLATVTATVTADGRVAGHATFQFYILSDRGVD